jgi:hypothetical protein
MYSKTYGKVSVEKMVEIIKDYTSDINYQYKISIGTDSQNTNLTKVVLVVAIHRVGKGGIFFYDIKNVKKIKNLHQKIYFETAWSLEMATKLEIDLRCDLEIHTDIGKLGKTSILVNEIMGWINSSGFVCKIKPEAYCASCIADRISK